MSRASSAGGTERLLGELQDRVQMDLTAVYLEEPLLREVLAENPSLAAARRLIRARPGTTTHFERIRVGAGLSHAIEEKRRADEAAILHELQDWAVAVTTEGPRHARMVLNAAFLVERGRLDEFHERVEQISRERADRMEFRLLGPRPAHSFV